MFFNVFIGQSNIYFNCFRKNTGKEITRFTSPLILLVTFGLSSVQAADISCTWMGGALDTGQWTDSNWSSDSGCSGTFPNNNATTSSDATHPRGTVILDRDITIETFNLAGGTLTTGSNTLTVNKVFNWTRGTLSGTGAVRAVGGLELNGNLTFKDSATVINSAGQEANWSQGNIIMNNGESGFVNEAEANFNVTGDDKRMLVLGRGAKFDNDGTFTTDLSSADSVVTVNSRMNNHGLVHAQKGELRLGGGGISTGLFVAGEQGKINFSGKDQVLQADSIVAGTNVEFSQLGVTTIEGAYNVVGTVLKPGGTANFNAELSQTETLTMSGGNLRGSGTLMVTGETTFSSGQMTGTGITFANGGLDFNGNFMAIRGERVLATGGQRSNWTKGTIFLRDEGSILFNQPGTVFVFEADRGRIFGKGVVANAGAVVVNLPDGADPVVIKSNFTNLGQLILQGDNLAIGSEEPPNFFDTEVSLFNGNFIQTETGTTFFDISGNIAGEEYDVLNVIENALLGGTLDITLGDGPTNPFMPAVGDFFDILTAKTILVDGLVLGGVDGDLFDFGIVGLETGNQALRIRAVPIPAAIWLFMSALLGLWRIGIRRSR